MRSLANFGVEDDVGASEYVGRQEWDLDIV